MDGPNPALVGRAFVKQYYTQMHRDPVQMHRFYLEESSFAHGGADNGSEEPVLGQKAIYEKIVSLELRQVHAKIKQVDSHATLGKGIVIQVTGELSIGGRPMRAFVQTFVLAPQSPKKYYVHNDIFRYQDDDLVSESETTEVLGEAESAAISEALPEEIDYHRPPSSDMLKEDSALYVPPQSAELVRLPEHSLSEAAPPPELVGSSGWEQQLEEPQAVQQNGLAEDVAGEGGLLGGTPPQGYPLDSPALIYQEEGEGGVGEGEGLLSVAESFPSPAEVQEPESKGAGGTWASRLSNKAPSYSQVGAPAKLPPSAIQPAPAQRPANPSVAPQREQRPQRRGEAVRTGPPKKPPMIMSAREAPDSYQIFVGGLPPNTSEEELRNTFSKYGIVCDVRINQKNFAFVVFDSSEAVQRVIQDKVFVGGKQLNIEQKRPSVRGPGRAKVGMAGPGNPKPLRGGERVGKVPKR